MLVQQLVITRYAAVLCCIGDAGRLLCSVSPGLLRKPFIMFKWSAQMVAALNAFTPCCTEQLMREATMAHAPPSIADGLRAELSKHTSRQARPDDSKPSASHAYSSLPALGTPHPLLPTSQAPDQHQQHHLREQPPQGLWVVKQKAPAAAQQQQQQEQGVAGYLVKEDGHTDQGHGLVSIQLHQQKDRAHHMSPASFARSSVEKGREDGGSELGLAIDVKALLPPVLSKHSTASVRPLLVRAHACKDEVRHGRTCSKMLHPA